MRKRGLVLPMLLVPALFPTAADAQHKLGTEFEVNQYTTGDQQAASVASDDTGNFVVVWESNGQDGSSYGIFGQRYDSGGNALGDEFQVNTFTVRDQRDPSVASDPTGNFVVVWQDSGRDGSDDGVFGRRYDQAGMALGTPFRVNTYTTSDQSDPSVAMDPNGNFVVVWSSNGQDGYSWGIFGQRYDATGNRLGPEFQANTFTGNHESGAHVSSAANGNFVVVWGAVAGGSYYADYAPVRGQRYDSDGNRQGGELILGTKPRSPSVASDAAGNFIVVWDEYIEFQGHTAQAQKYDPSGHRVGNQFQVNTSTHIARPAISVAPRDGDFVVVWHNTNGHDGDQYGVFGQLYDSHGKKGEEFQVNTYTPGYQKAPSVSLNESGSFIVVWNDGAFFGNGQDGSSYGVFGQRFSAGCQASVAVEGDIQGPGGTLRIQVHIAHRRPNTVTVPWELSLADSTGQVIARHITEPHTFEPGDVVDKEIELRLPESLASGRYTVELGIRGMGGTGGAATSFRVGQAE